MYTLEQAVEKLIKEFNWDYISGRMHGSKWKWFNSPKPSVSDLKEQATRLGKKLSKTDYISCGGITFEKYENIVTLWFGKKRKKAWLTQFEIHKAVGVEYPDLHPVKNPEFYGNVDKPRC